MRIMATATALVVAAGCGTALIGPTAEERAACAELRDLADALAVGDQRTAAVEEYASAANRTDSLATTARALRETWRNVMATHEATEAVIDQTEKAKEQAQMGLEVAEFAERELTSSEVAWHERAQEAVRDAREQARTAREAAAGRFDAGGGEAAQACADVGVEVAR